MEKEKIKLPRPYRDRKMVGILVIILLIILVPLGVFLFNDNSNAQSAENCNCFSVNPYLPATVNNGTSQIDAKQANNTAINGTLPAYAQVSEQNNTIVFHSMNISLLVFADSNAWVSAITNMSIPAYDNVSSLSNAFAIYHLFLPALVIPRGATLNITFINMDYTDHHNFVLTTFSPPFPEFIMQNMAAGGEMVQMTPLIPPENNATGTASEYQYTVVLNLPSSVSKMWYMCMFPNHAMLGMYGNITLVNPSSVAA